MRTVVIAILRCKVQCKVVYFLPQDIGCGVGGPARNIARYSGAEITGLNINDYQLKKATKLTAEANLQHLIKYDKVLIYTVLLYIAILSVMIIILHAG